MVEASAGAMQPQWREQEPSGVTAHTLGAGGQAPAAGAASALSGHVARRPSVAVHSDLAFDDAELEREFRLQYAR